MIAVTVPLPGGAVAGLARRFTAAGKAPATSMAAVMLDEYLAGVVAALGIDGTWVKGFTDDDGGGLLLEVPESEADYLKALRH
jgi:hypothetical protein